MCFLHEKLPFIYVRLPLKSKYEPINISAYILPMSKIIPPKKQKKDRI